MINESTNPARYSMSANQHNELRRQEADRRSRWIAGKYRGLVQQGFKDPLGEISHQTGISVAQVKHYVKRGGITPMRRDIRALRRDAIIEEVTFFLSIGAGLHEIAHKLDLADQELIDNLRRWKTDGLLEHLSLDWLLNPGEQEYHNQYTAA